jgi:hypothetical protein
MFRPRKRRRFVGGVGGGEASSGVDVSRTNAKNHQPASSCWLDASPFLQQQQQQEQFSPFLHTPLLATAVTRDIFLERFQKEIIDRFQFSLHYGGGSVSSSTLLSSSTTLPGDEESSFTDDARHCHLQLKRRIVVGFNACTKALQQSSWCYSHHHHRGTRNNQQHINKNNTNTDDPLAKTPSLVVVALDDNTELALKKISPQSTAMLLAHIPLLARQAGVPLLILPGPRNASQHLNRLLKGPFHSSSGSSSRGSTLGRKQQPKQQVTTTTTMVTSTTTPPTTTDPNRKHPNRQHRMPSSSSSCCGGVTIMTFLPRADDANDKFTSSASAGQQQHVIHDAVDSFVDFFKSKACCYSTK